MDLLYDGKTKALYSTPNEDIVLMEFKDVIQRTSDDQEESIRSKGFYNSYISATIFKHLEKYGIRTHFLGLLQERYHLVRSLQILPMQVTIRNVASGGFARRFGIREGEELDRPVMEFFYKSDELGDPWLNRYHLRALEICSGDEEIVRLEEDAWRIHAALGEFFEQRGLVLVDMQFEFGRDEDGLVVLADEISPDTCRLWDEETGERLDRDRFHFNLGDTEEAYREVYRRVAWKE